MSIAINVGGGRRFAENLPGKPLSHVLQQAGLPLDLQCAGLGVCGKCRIQLVEGHFMVAGEQVAVAAGQPRTALACRTLAIGENAEIAVPEGTLLKVEGKIFDQFPVPEHQFDPLVRKYAVKVPEIGSGVPGDEWGALLACLPAAAGLGADTACPLAVARELPGILAQTRLLTVSLAFVGRLPEVVRLEADDRVAENLGLAVDIGTTTVVAALVDLNSGVVIARASSYNQQMSRADDVASRISAASADGDSLLLMAELVVERTINPLIAKACAEVGRDPHDILAVAVSGNTVMTHLFLGVSPEGIGRIPFSPVANVHAATTASELGLNSHPCAPVLAAPSIAGYIGGDVTSDLLAIGLASGGEPGLRALIDLGTNSEMVVVVGGKILAAAAAAGPAFEGAGIARGCRAVAGAIERINANPDGVFTYSTIGGSPPIGVCGSAVVDFIATTFRAGLMNEFGRFDIEKLKLADRYLAFPGTAGGTIHACVVAAAAETANGEAIYISEADVEQIIKAKAAVAAGLATLLEQLGHGVRDLDKLFLAGGFAKYIDIDNAVAIGMLPDIPRERIANVGNGSLAGAYLTLVDRSTPAAMRRIIPIPEVVSLNTIPSFQDNFIDAMPIPSP